MYKGTSKLFRNKKFMMDQKLQKETLIKIWKKNKAQIFFRPLICVSGLLFLPFSFFFFFLSFFVFGLFMYNFMWFIKLRVWVGMCQCMWVCRSVGGCACVWCVGLRWCTSGCGCRRLNNNEFSEYFLETRVQVSVAFNTYPIRFSFRFSLSTNPEIVRRE